MAYVREYRLKNGARRFAARYLGADGKYHEEKGFASHREAEKAASKREVDATRGDWASPAAGRITFKAYVDDTYWPTAAHLEVSTRAAYRYYLDKHFLPRFGDLPMRRIGPPLIQSWVNDATSNGLSASSAVKYHAFLHKIFARAVIDHVIAANPCTHTALPKVIKKPKRIITVTVLDRSSATPEQRARSASFNLEESGRGMAIVASLADDFGWRRLPDRLGKVMWFVVALPHSD